MAIFDTLSIPETIFGSTGSTGSTQFSRKNSPRHLAGTCDSPGCAQTCALPRPWFVHWKASHPSRSADPTSVNETARHGADTGGASGHAAKKTASYYWVNGQCMFCFP